MIILNPKPHITYTVDVQDPQWWHEITSCHMFGSSDPRKSGDATFNLEVTAYTFRARIEQFGKEDRQWYLKYKEIFDHILTLEFDSINFHFYDEVMYKKTAKKFAKKWGQKI